MRSWLAEKEKTVEALVTLPLKSADLHHLMETQRVCCSCINTIVTVYRDCTVYQYTVIDYTACAA